MNLNEVAKRCHDDAKKLGWYDEGKVKSDVESLMMTVTELAEAVEELRTNKPMVYYNLRNITGSTITTDPKHPDANPKPEGFAVELADAVIRLLDLAQYKGIDLEKVIADKLDYNLTRGYRHGNKNL